jgi:hypothetical protein
VRAAAGISAQVRHLPFVFPVARAQGRDSGCKQIELVEDRDQVSVIRDQFSAALLAAIVEVEAARI